jgi:hypothetical protein
MARSAREPRAHTWGKERCRPPAAIHRESLTVVAFHAVVPVFAGELVSAARVYIVLYGQPAYAYSCDDDGVVDLTGNKLLFMISRHPVRTDF